MPASLSTPLTGQLDHGDGVVADEGEDGLRRSGFGRAERAGDGNRSEEGIVFAEHDVLPILLRGPIVLAFGTGRRRPGMHKRKILLRCIQARPRGVDRR